MEHKSFFSHILEEYFLSSAIYLLYNGNCLINLKFLDMLEKGQMRFFGQYEVSSTAGQKELILK